MNTLKIALAAALALVGVRGAAACAGAASNEEYLNKFAATGEMRHMRGDSLFGDMVGHHAEWWVVEADGLELAAAGLMNAEGLPQESFTYQTGIIHTQKRVFWHRVDEWLKTNAEIVYRVQHERWKAVDADDAKFIADIPNATCADYMTMPVHLYVSPTLYVQIAAAKARAKAAEAAAALSRR